MLEYRTDGLQDSHQTSVNIYSVLFAFIRLTLRWGCHVKGACVSIVHLAWVSSQMESIFDSPEEFGQHIIADKKIKCIWYCHSTAGTADPIDDMNP
jgi:hypothetical protein